MTFLTMEFPEKSRYGIEDLLEIMRVLRSDKGCPWDREQNHQSIRRDFIEEVYEAAEAIDTGDAALLREELGDVLLQVVFHSCIEEEKNSFTFGDVTDEVCRKLIVRHPHVFGDVTVSGPGEVLRNWNNIKQETKGQETYSETLESVCRTLPALMRAQKVGQRAKRAGMDFDGVDSAIKALEDEISELKAEFSKNGENIRDELGDVLFSAVNVSRLLGFDAEETLGAATDKFTGRFRETENLIRCDGIDMKSLSINELDAYWRKVKNVKYDLY